MEHWSRYLVQKFTAGEPGKVEFDVDPDVDDSSAVVVASRVRGVYDAVKRGREALREETTEDLLRLADHLQRAVRGLTLFQDWVVIELRRREVSTRKIGRAMQTNHMAIARREQRLLRAGDDDPSGEVGRDSS